MRQEARVMRADEIHKAVIQVIDSERRRNRELANNPHFDQGTTIAYAAAASCCTDVKRAINRKIRALQAANGGGDA